MSTKSVKISEKVHDVLKVHVAKQKTSIVDYVDKAILDRIQLDKIVERNQKAIKK